MTFKNAVIVMWRKARAGSRSAFRQLPFIFPVVAVCTVLLTFAVHVARQPVERVIIVGDMGDAHREALQHWLTDNVNDAVAAWDLDETEALIEGLPWIKAAAATRLWPNTMRISVQPHLPVAQWGDGSFLNAQGQVFEPVPGSEDWVLPKLSGDLNQQAELMDLYLGLSRLLSRSDDVRLDSVSMDSLGQMDVQLTNGVRLKLGRESHLTRFQRFLTWRERFSVKVNSQTVIDLRYRNALAVSDGGVTGLLAASAQPIERGY